MNDNDIPTHIIDPVQSDLERAARFSITPKYSLFVCRIDGTDCKLDMYGSDASKIAKRYCSLCLSLNPNEFCPHLRCNGVIVKLSY